MTDQTNVAQPVLTDSEILAIGAMHGRPSVALLPMFRALEGAVLSKLRAPAADTPQMRRALEGMLAVFACGAPQGESPTIDAARAALASAPVAGEVVAWAAIPSRGTRAGRIYTTCDTRKEIDAYIELVHQSNDSLTLTPRPLSFADAAPQATTEARPSLDAVDLARAGMALHAPGAPEHTVCAELVRLADVLKQPQAEKDGGQQRAGNADKHEKMRNVLQWIVDDAASGGVAKLRPQQEKRARAALSAPQAEQGERDE